MPSQDHDRSRYSASSCRGNTLDEGPDLLVLRETLVEGPDDDHEKIHRQKYTQRRGAGANHSRYKIADESNRNHHRAGRDHRDRDGVKELSLGQLVVNVTAATVKKR